MEVSRISVFSLVFNCITIKVLSIQMHLYKRNEKEEQHISKSNLRPVARADYDVVAEAGGGRVFQTLGIDPAYHHRANGSGTGGEAEAGKEGGGMNLTKIFRDDFERFCSKYGISKAVMFFPSEVAPEQWYSLAKDITDEEVGEMLKRGFEKRISVALSTDDRPAPQ